MYDYDAKLGLYSNKNLFAEKLKSKFQEKYIDVVIFDDLKNKNLKDFNYLVLNLLEIEPNDKRHDLQSIIKEVSTFEHKVVVLFPLFVKAEEKYVADINIKDLIDSNPNLEIILVPELLGKGVKYNSKYVSHHLIMQSLISERIKINESLGLINTISLTKLIDVVLKETLSFGSSGQVVALIGPRRGLRSFALNYLNVDEKNIIFQKGEAVMVEVDRTSSIKVDFSLRLNIKATIAEIKEELEKKEILVSNQETLIPKFKPSVETNPKPRKMIGILFKFLVFMLSLLLIPLISLFMSILFLYSSVRFANKDIDLSKKLINFSNTAVNITQGFSFGMPVYYNYSNIVHKATSLFEEALIMSEIGNELASNVIGKEIYDLHYYTENLSASLDKIHTDIGFLQSDIDEFNGYLGTYFKKYLIKNKIDISLYREKVFFVKTFSSRLSNLLGVDRPMKYLVLFQNNMELRPTGGFIGSFAILTVDKGRLTDIAVSDVYSADGQLKGHVDPPEPIRKHLGEGGWYLRDSNWDPNFPDSAVKAEWFLDKEINVKVDGVMAIDLFFIQNLLKITGPIQLEDFNLVIDSDNLYQTTQNEVESDFFPGSIKKATFMTSLAKKLIFELQNLSKEKYFGLIKTVYSSLEARHIQIFLHDNNAQESISGLGYSGEIDMSTDCGPRCFESKYSLIDANLGVNKSNLFISRVHNLKLNLTRSKIGHELLVTYKNNAVPAVGNSGLYKSYTRILIPQNAVINGIRAYQENGEYSDLEYDTSELNGRKEVGFLIEVLPSTSKTIQVSWNINTTALEKGGEYRILVRKQAGTESDGLNVNLNYPEFTLTGRPVSVYTTNLSEDFKTTLFFK